MSNRWSALEQELTETRSLGLGRPVSYGRRSLLGGRAHAFDDGAKKIVGGEVKDKTVVQKLNLISEIEKAALAESDIKAIVVHQTDSSTAASTISAWKKDKSTGAHFLIDTDGTVHQTARVNQKVWHVGKIRSRCLDEKKCDDKSTEHKLYNAAGKSYGTRVNDLYDHEKKKAYPDRYPMNEDSIGIEIVGPCDKKAANIPKGEDCAYAAPSTAQNEALTKLVKFLKDQYKLGDADVYRHPLVSYKTSTEARDADWNYKPPKKP